MSPAPTSAGPFTLLVVGAENIRRSALAERVAVAYLADVLGEDAAATVRVTSAGTAAAAGAVMDENSALVLRGLGGDPERFWAQPLTPAHIATADLVLATSRHEREDALALAPRALGRTFTLLEAADLLDGLDVAEDWVPARARELVRAMAAVRSGRRSADADDVPGLAGRPLKVHEAVGETVADAVVRVVGRLLGVPEEDRPAPRRAARRPASGWRRLLRG